MNENQLKLHLEKSYKQPIENPTFQLKSNHSEMF